jgi:hypothetical protein
VNSEERSLQRSQYHECADAQEGAVWDQKHVDSSHYVDQDLVPPRADAAPDIYRQSADCQENHSANTERDADDPNHGDWKRDFLMLMRRGLPVALRLRFVG